MLTTIHTPRRVYQPNEILFTMNSSALRPVTAAPLWLAAIPGEVRGLEFLQLIEFTRELIEFNRGNSGEQQPVETNCCGTI